MILTSTGLFSCGANTYGQLGIGDEEEKTIEDAIHHVSVSHLLDSQGLEREQIEMVESGGDFCYALTTDGEVFSWGLNVCGNLGLGDYDNRSEPTKVECLSAESASLSKKAKFNMKDRLSMKRSKSREALGQQS